MLQQWDAGMGEVEASGSGQEEDKEVNQEAAKVKKISWLKYAAVVAVLIGVVYAGELWMDGVELERLEQKYAGVELPASDINRTRSATLTDDMSPLKLRAYNIYDLALIELEQGNYREGDRYLRESLILFEEIVQMNEDSSIVLFLSSIKMTFD